MKLDPNKPGALSFKVLDIEAGSSGTPESRRPPLTPSTEVDLQKSCAILIQSTKYSTSFRDASIATQMSAARRDVSGRGYQGALGNSGSHSSGGASRGSGTRTPATRREAMVNGGGRVGKGHHRRGSSRVKISGTTIVSDYVPPRRPAPAKNAPGGRYLRKGSLKGKDVEKEEEISEELETIDDKHITKGLPILDRRVSTEAAGVVERKSSDTGGSGEDGEKSRKGVKKLMTAVTGYIRPPDLVTSPSGFTSAPPLRRKSSTKTSEIPTSILKQAPPEQELISPIEEPVEHKEIPKRIVSPAPIEKKVEFFVDTKDEPRRKDKELSPNQLHFRASTEEERKPQEIKRSVSKRMGQAMKDYVKPPYVDRFTPEPLAPPKEERKQKHDANRVSRAMKDYVKPPPISVLDNLAVSEEPAQPKSSKMPKPEQKTPNTAPIIFIPVEVNLDAPAPPTIKKSASKPDLRKAARDKEQPKSKSPPSTSHNPFRKFSNYVKPQMSDPTQPSQLQTNISPQSSTHLSPTSPSDRQTLSSQKSMPTITYVPPKIRPRGRTLPGSDAPAFPGVTESTEAKSASARPGPIFGGGYPVKQEITVKDKENKGPISPGMFGRNPSGHGFKIHLPSFLHKQHQDGYDQLE